MNERRWCTLAAVGETLCSNSFFAGLFLLKRKREKFLFWHDRWLDGQMIALNLSLLSGMPSMSLLS